MKNEDINHLIRIEQDSEGFSATCSCGRWFVNGCDTKRDAIDAHEDHEAAVYEV